MGCTFIFTQLSAPEQEQLSLSAGPASGTHLEITEPRQPSSLEPQKQEQQKAHIHIYLPHITEPPAFRNGHLPTIQFCSHILLLALRNSNKSIRKNKKKKSQNPFKGSKREWFTFSSSLLLSFIFSKICVY